MLNGKVTHHIMRNESEFCDKVLFAGRVKGTSCLNVVHKRKLAGGGEDGKSFNLPLLRRMLT
jgi:hypothetical protein